MPTCTTILKNLYNPCVYVAPKPLFEGYLRARQLIDWYIPLLDVPSGWCQIVLENKILTFKVIFTKKSRDTALTGYLMKNFIQTHEWDQPQTQNKTKALYHSFMATVTKILGVDITWSTHKISHQDNIFVSLEKLWQRVLSWTEQLQCLRLLVIVSPSNNFCRGYYDTFLRHIDTSFSKQETLCHERCLRRTSCITLLSIELNSL